MTDSPSPRDYTALVVLGVLAFVEVAVLYVLIAVDTPVAPLVRRAMENPAGIFAVVMIVVTLLCFGMAGFLSWAEWLHKRHAREGGTLRK